MKILILIDNHPLSSMMRIARNHLQLVRGILPTAKIAVVSISQTGDLNRHLKDAEIIIPTVNINHLNLGGSRKLKWVHFTSAGINNKLPKTLLNPKILITNSSGVHPIPIAEHVFAFMLIFSRQINKAMRLQIRKEWIRNTEFFLVSELRTKTIGIVGLGRIGLEIAKLAKCFGMKVLAIRKQVGKKESDVDELFSLKGLPRVLAESDYLINSLPATPETHHLFDLKKFKQMKSTAYFINIGRGQTVKETDLITALKDGVISGAGLDVFEEEPLPKTSPFWEMENVIITPHYSGWTPYYMDRVIEIFCQNLKAYLKNKPMPNLVDLKRGY